MRALPVKDQPSPGYIWWVWMISCKKYSESDRSSCTRFFTLTLIVKDGAGVFTNSCCGAMKGKTARADASLFLPLCSLLCSKCDSVWSSAGEEAQKSSLVVQASTQERIWSQYLVLKKTRTSFCNSNLDVVKIFAVVRNLTCRKA